LAATVQGNAMSQDWSDKLGSMLADRHAAGKLHQADLGNSPIAPAQHREVFSCDSLFVNRFRGRKFPRSVSRC
jgi:hypothetical protein